MDLPLLNLGNVFSALLLLLRVSVLVILMPVLGHRLVPTQVKIGLIGLISILLYPVVSTSLPHLPVSPGLLAFIAVQEILIAAVLSMLAQIIFAAAQLAGQVMSYQMGLAIANVVDPATSAQIAAVSQFSIVMAMLVWLVSGAHHSFLYALMDSFQILPIGQPLALAAGWSAMNSLAGDMFVLALRLVAPMLLLLFFLYVALGLLSRAVPQIQVFFVSFPLTVGVGFLAFALALPAILILMNDSFRDVSSQIPGLLRSLAGT